MTITCDHEAVITINAIIMGEHYTNSKQYLPPKLIVEKVYFGK